MKLSNNELELRLTTLQSFLSRTDIIGYAAARNTRIIKNTLTEYFEKQQYLIKKYGEPKEDENGINTGFFELSVLSPNFKLFKSELEQFAIIEHDVELFKIPYSEVIGKLTGSEILEIDWMLEDSDSLV